MPGKRPQIVEDCELEGFVRIWNVSTTKDRDDVVEEADASFGLVIQTAPTGDIVPQEAYARRRFVDVL